MGKIRALQRGAVLVLITVSPVLVAGQANTPNSPAYRIVEGWAQVPASLKLGVVSAIQVGPDDNIYALHRCGGDSCAASNDPPILKFDRSGRLLQSWGAGMFAWPHGIFVDRDGAVWVTDGRGEAGKGHQVFKFTPDGQLVMTLGRKGIAGNDRDTFNGPSDVAVSRAGDVFVLDGHSCNDQNAGICTSRVVRFSKDGKFVKAWGRTGSKAAEFRMPHGLFFDSRDRLIVCDRFNARLQIFDADGNLLDTWKAFGRPAGVFVTRDDTMYVVDNWGGFDTNGTPDPVYANLKPGLYIGSAKDGSVSSFIPDEIFGPEDITADKRGDIYVAESYPQTIRKFIVDPARVRWLLNDLRR